MKKTLKTLTTFLLLFAIITTIQPIHPAIDINTEPEISVCTDDDENFEDIIRFE